MDVQVESAAIVAAVLGAKEMKATRFEPARVDVMKSMRDLRCRSALATASGEEEMAAQLKEQYANLMMAYPVLIGGGRH